MDDLERALDSAYKYLSYRARSIHEVREHLSKKGYSDEVIEEALDRLMQYGYLDDLEFARQFVRSKSDWGSRRLKYELARKRVHESIIAQTVPSSDDEISRCRRLAQAYIRRRGPLLDQTLKRKLWAFLMRRGFASDIVESAVKWLGQDAPDD
ncbi:MAG: regulatory protein RecX [Firmicutes bacterium]|nr:regulatory protein RecX [Bacillota bacterium]